MATLSMDHPLHISQGKLIGRGNEYDVYNGVVTPDGVHRVVKIPKTRWYYRRKPHTREEAEQDYTTVTHYFNKPNEQPFFAHTLFTGEGTNFKALQEQLMKPSFIRRRDLQDPAIRNALQEALRRNGEMLKLTGKSLGILGKGGALGILRLQPRITNLLLDHSGEKPVLRGVDFGLLRRGNIYHKLSLLGNEIVLRTAFGLTLSGENSKSPFRPRLQSKQT